MSFLDFNYSKLKELEKALGNAWLVMNIRQPMKLTNEVLATKTTVMVLDYLANYGIEDKACFELCCASQRDYRGKEELKLDDLPQCHLNVIHDIIGNQMEFKKGFKKVMSVLGDKDTEVEIVDDQDTLTTILVECIRARKLSEPLDAEEVLPKDLTAFLICNSL